MRPNTEGSIKNGLFDLPTGHRLPGTLHLKGPDSLLHLWSSDRTGLNASEIKTVHGTLDDQTKVSIIGCLNFYFGEIFGPDGVSQHYKFFPHYVVVGHQQLSHSEKSIHSVAFVVDDAPALFHDRETFRTSHVQAADLETIHSLETFRQARFENRNAIVAYYTGKAQIFSVDTVIGTVSARNCPSFSLGGPQGAKIENTILVYITFAEPVNIDEMDSRLRKLLRFFEALVGRQQNLMEVNIALQDDEPVESSSVYLNMYSGRDREADTWEPDFRDILVDAVREQNSFEQILCDWMKRDEDWLLARSRFSNGWSRPHQYSIDRLIGAANMFDLLPKGAVGVASPVSEDISAAIQLCKQRLKEINSSAERDEALSVLGSIGRQSLKDKVGHRVKCLTEIIESQVPEIEIVADYAIDLRNLYVHGSATRAKKDKLPKFIAFFTDTLEFVFCASDFVELGWNVKSWINRPNLARHPFSIYLNAYRDKLQVFQSEFGLT